MQGGLPDGGSTQTFASSLLDKLPRSSGRASQPSYAQQERAKAALASRNRGYALLEGSDEEEEAPMHAPAPTTSALPISRPKQIRKAKVGRPHSAALERAAIIHLTMHSLLGEVETKPCDLRTHLLSKDSNPPYISKV